MIQLVRKYPHRLTELFLQKAAELSGVTLESLEYSWKQAVPKNGQNTETGEITITLDPDAEDQKVNIFGKMLAPYEMFPCNTVFENYDDQPSFIIDNILEPNGFSKDDVADYILLRFFTFLYLQQLSPPDYKEAFRVFFELGMEQYEMIECINEHGHAMKPPTIIPPS